MVRLELALRVDLRDDRLDAQEGHHEDDSDVEEDNIDAHAPQEAPRDATCQEPDCGEDEEADVCYAQEKHASLLLIFDLIQVYVANDVQSDRHIETCV